MSCSDVDVLLMNASHLNRNGTVTILFEIFAVCDIDVMRLKQQSLMSVCDCG